MKKEKSQSKANGIIIFDDYYEHIKELPSKDVKDLMLAVFEYHLLGKEPKLELAPKMVFKSIKKDLDRNSLKYLETCQRNKENIEKRWAKHKSGNTTEYDGIRANTKDTNKDKDNNKKKDKETYRRFAHLAISSKEVEKLKQDYDIANSEVDELLDSIENYKKNTKYTNLYLTCRSWLNKNQKKQEEMVNTHDKATLKCIEHSNSTGLF